MTLLLTATSVSDLHSWTAEVESHTTLSWLAPGVLEGFEMYGANTRAYLDLSQKADDFWVALTQYRGGSSSWTNPTMLLLIDSNYGPYQGVLRINQIGSSGGFRPQRFDGSAWVDMGGALFTPPTNTASRYDFHVKISETEGIVECYMNGILVSTSTFPNTKLPGVVGIDRLGFGGTYNGCPLSGIIVATEDTRGMVLLQTRPSAEGGLSEWEGPYSHVDDPGLYDYDFIATAQEGDTTYQFTTPDVLYDSEAYEFVGVVLSTRLQQDNLDVHALIRTDDTNHDGGSFGADRGIKPRSLVYEVNPVTGLPWTYTDFTTYEFGFSAQ